MERLSNIQLFLIDLDGTVYFEDNLIPGAKEFVDKLINEGKDYVFVSNNSSVNKEVYLNKLNSMKIKCDESNVFSSSMATAKYLSEHHKDARIFPIGTKAFEEELLKEGLNLVIEDANLVVVGFDRELSYGKLEKACYFLDNGALFYAANPDLVYPLKNKRYIPDCGSICMMITNATKKEPIYIGKPNKYIVDVIAKRKNVSKENIVIIGDRLYTDILTGKNAGIKSVCVLTGEATKEDIENSLIKPDYVFDSIKELINLI